MPKPLELHRGDTWFLDLAVTGLPPLAGGPAGPLPLAGCTVQLAVGKGGGAPAEFVESYQIPASDEAAAGLTRLVVTPNLTQPVVEGNYKVHARVTTGGAIPFVATQCFTPLRVLPSLLPPAGN